MQPLTPAHVHPKADESAYIPVASTNTNIPAVPAGLFNGVKCTATIGPELFVLLLTNDPSELVVAVELCLDRAYIPREEMMFAHTSSVTRY